MMGYPRTTTVFPEPTWWNGDDDRDLDADDPRWHEKCDHDDYDADILEELRGKNLACWCPLDQPCHGDVLLELANSKE